MHGCATGSGAQPGNQNALKQGLHTREEKESRAAIRRELEEYQEVINKIQGALL